MSYLRPRSIAGGTFQELSNVRLEVACPRHSLKTFDDGIKRTYTVDIDSEVFFLDIVVYFRLGRISRNYDWLKGLLLDASKTILQDFTASLTYH